MNRRWKPLSIGSLVLTLLSISETGFACVCTRPPLPCEAYWQVEAVFIGTAKELSWIEFEEKLEGFALKRKRPVFRFSVDQAFRGVNGAQAAVMTGIGGGDTYEGVETLLIAQIEIERGKWMRGELKAAESGDLVGVKLILAPQKDN